MSGQVDVIIGAQMGDEGKGRFTYQLAGEGYAISARFNGGANAGHTFEYLENEINTHQIPSGISYPGVMNLLTNCSLFDPSAIQHELAEIRSYGIEVSPDNLGISDSTSLVLPHHVMQDQMREVGAGKQGSTKRGISFVAADKFAREGVFFHQLETDPDLVEEKVVAGIKAANVLLQDIGGNAFFLVQDPKETYEAWLRDAKSMLPYMVDTIDIVGDSIRKGDRILAEGAQSIGLDIDHGVRSENTSSLTGVAGAQQSLGIGPKHIGQVFEVAKLIKSRVGGTDDSFPTKIYDEELAEKLRGNPGQKDYEAGKTSKRKRDMGWFDLADIATATTRNEVARMELFLTKLDCLPQAGETFKVATHYVDEQGEIVFERPNHVDKLRKCTPVSEEFPSWDEDIRGYTDFDALPATAKRFIDRIEELAGLPVTMIGTGPDKHELIDRRS